MKWFTSLFQKTADGLKTKQVPSSKKPTLSQKKVQDFTLVIAFAVFMGLVSGLFVGKMQSPEDGTSNSQVEENSEESETAPKVASDSQLIIDFRNGGSHRSQKPFTAAKGSLVRVRLLNEVETFEAAPVFAQIVDGTLGKSNIGATLLGEASGDANSERIKISFHSIKSVSGTENFKVTGRALSLDGTLGIAAKKVEGLLARSGLAGAKAGASGMSSQLTMDSSLGSFLIRALVEGAQGEATSDLGARYNQGAVLRLGPGAEFFVELTEGY